MFYNTNSSSPQMVIQFTAETLTQEDRIVEVYRATKKAMAWWEVAAFIPDMHEGSVKRCLTDLCDKGLLEKTEELVTGKYGKSTHRYRIFKK